MTGRPRRPGSARRLVAVTAFVASLLVTLTVGVARSLPAKVAECASDNKITLATGSDVSAGSFRRDLIQQWNRRPNVVPAELVEIADYTDKERAEMAASAQSGSCRYDIYVVDVAWTAEFAANGYLQEIPAKILESVGPFLPNMLETGRFDGRQYAVPFAADAPLLYRRRDLPLPGTPQRLAELGRRHGYTGQFADYEGGSVNLQETILSYGAKIVEGDEVVLDRPGNREKALSALTAWNTVLNDLGSPTDLREESSLQAFRKRPGYMRNWPFAFPRLIMDPSMRDDEGPIFTVSPLPGVGVLGGFNLAVAARSPDPTAAHDLIRFLVSAESQRDLLACGGYLPVLPAVYDAYRADPRCGRPEAATDPDLEIPREALQEFADAIAVAVRNTVPRPRAAHYITFSEVFRSCAHQVVSGALPPQELDFDRYGEALREAMAGRRTAKDMCRG
ncbi:ABC transporter substrate-binding protein [Microtetraspora sp. NBRC 13810]|uniref:extracellular solute-binding protein n=1 Tax=Microtetraspora sp. NBRC 13810 TaxID=3030990 RepID=UPI0024A342A7|nr:extracellular solute-binding protein [Microtetraspora sp. NBRC 13810]GLW07536.1 ABC transporter substrate-binding protein [Microtetraspora sp. NBRC 13810]